MLVTYSIHGAFGPTRIGKAASKKWKCMKMQEVLICVDPTKMGFNQPTRDMCSQTNLDVANIDQDISGLGEHT